jgi:hypothetical protein
MLNDEKCKRKYGGNIVNESRTALTISRSFEKVKNEIFLPSNVSQKMLLKISTKQMGTLRIAEKKGNDK